MSVPGSSSRDRLPPELQLQVLDHLFHLIYTEACEGVPQLDGTRGVVWPWHFIQTLEVVPDEYMLDAPLPSGDRQERCDFPDWRDSLLPHLQVCRYWYVMLQRKMRSAPKSDQVVAHTEKMPERTDSVRALFIKGDDVPREMQAAPAITLMAGSMGSMLTFLHYSDHSLTHYEMCFRENGDNYICELLSETNWKASGELLLQFMISCCPNLRWLEFTMRNRFMNFFPIKDWPGEYICNLRHPKLETLILSAPVVFKETQEVPTFRLDGDGTAFPVDFHREIDPDIFHESRFQLEGLPCLKNIGISEALFEVESSEEARRQWAVTLKRRGLCFWFGYLHDRAPGEYYQLLPCDGTESVDEIKEALRRIPWPNQPRSSRSTSPDNNWDARS